MQIEDDNDFDISLMVSECIEESSEADSTITSKKESSHNIDFRCNVCNSLNLNSQEGYVACKDCGNCIRGSLIDYSFEARNYGTDKSSGNPRIGPAIDNGETPVTGSVGNGQGSMLLKKVSQWMAPAYNIRRNHTIKNTIITNCNKAEPPISVIIQKNAIDICLEVLPETIRRKMNRQAFLAGCVYLACSQNELEINGKMQNSARTPDELAEIFGVTKNKKKAAKMITNNCQFIKMFLHNKKNVSINSKELEDDELDDEVIDESNVVASNVATPNVAAPNVAASKEEVVDDEDELEKSLGKIEYKKIKPKVSKGKAVETLPIMVRGTLPSDLVPEYCSLLRYDDEDWFYTEEFSNTVLNIVRRLEEEKLTSNHIPKSIVSACIYYVIANTDHYKHYTKEDIHVACNTSVVTIMKCYKDIENEYQPLLISIDRRKNRERMNTMGEEFDENDLGLHQYLRKIKTLKPYKFSIDMIAKRKKDKKEAKKKKAEALGKA